MTALASYVALARPRGVVWVSTLPLIGVGIGHWDRALPLQDGPAVLWVVAAWACLQCGTMWLNACLDRDEGAVLLGESVPVPESMQGVGFVTLLVAIGFALAAGSMVAVLCGVCVCMSIGYSSRRLRLKGHPVWGPVINVIGYGVLSPLAGFWVVGSAFTPRAIAMLSLLPLWVFATYLAAQAFQEAEDRARGYRTFVVSHGPRVTLQTARVSAAAASVVVMMLALLGWLPRLLLGSLPAALLLDRFLSRWAEAEGDPRYVDSFVVHMLGLGITILGLATLQYGVDILGGGAVAGLATAAGH